jgi:hypothetical protein
VRRGISKVGEGMGAQERPASTIKAYDPPSEPVHGVRAPFLSPVIEKSKIWSIAPRTVGDTRMGILGYRMENRDETLARLSVEGYLRGFEDLRESPKIRLNPLERKCLSVSGTASRATDIRRFADVLRFGWNARPKRAASTVTLRGSPLAIPKKKEPQERV